jgi:uncharacterized caspase-like protein
LTSQAVPDSVAASAETQVVTAPLIPSLPPAPAETATFHNQRAPARGFFIVTSCSSVQVSKEREIEPGKPMGVFTEALVKGIETGAADLNLKGEILLSDLRRYLGNEIGEKESQSPQFFAHSASGDPLISLNPAALGRDVSLLSAPLGKRVALLIGNQSYRDDDLVPLRGPRNDVDALARVLRDPECGNFEVRCFLDKSRTEILSEISLALDAVERGDFLLIYYSGHGVLDRSGRLCLATSDTNRAALLATSIPARDLRDIIEDSDCDQVLLLLDCAYSGSMMVALK